MCVCVCPQNSQTKLGLEQCWQWVNHIVLRANKYLNTDLDKVLESAECEII